MFDIANISQATYIRCSGWIFKCFSPSVDNISFIFYAIPERTLSIYLLAMDVWVLYLRLLMILMTWLSWFFFLFCSHSICIYLSYLDFVWLAFSSQYNYTSRCEELIEIIWPRTTYRTIFSVPYKRREPNDHCYVRYIPIYTILHIVTVKNWSFFFGRSVVVLKFGHISFYSLDQFQPFLAVQSKYF